MQYKKLLQEATLESDDNKSDDNPCIQCINASSNWTTTPVFNRLKQLSFWQVKGAKVQYKKLLQEATLESDDNKQKLFSKYTV